MTTYNLSHVIISVSIGAAFVVAVLLAAALPALAAVYMLAGFAVRSIVVVLVVWAGSATLTLVLYQFISRTYIETVLRRRVVEDLPVPSTKR